MALRDQIRTAQTDAQKARDAWKTEVLRNAWSAIRNEEIDVKHELSDDEVVAVVSRLVKQLNDAIKDFRAGNRDDLVKKNEEEIALFQTFLPAQMTDDELRAAVQKVVSGFPEVTDIGKAMGAVMKEVKGKADGNRVRQEVQALLGEKKSAAT